EVDEFKLPKNLKNQLKTTITKVNGSLEKLNNQKIDDFIHIIDSKLSIIEEFNEKFNELDSVSWEKSNYKKIKEYSERVKELLKSWKDVNFGSMIDSAPSLFKKLIERISKGEPQELQKDDAIINEKSQQLLHELQSISPNEISLFVEKIDKIEKFEQVLCEWINVYTDYAKIAGKFKQFYEDLNNFKTDINFFDIQEELLNEINNIKESFTKKSAPSDFWENFIHELELNEELVKTFKESEFYAKE
ncbi:16212_t:CDS:2, partial [Racocetra fulgida]